MHEQPEGQPFSESNLDSAEYRERLMRKLNCLIAVLEVASAKVRRSLAGPAPDVERLSRIKRNLHDTLAVCLRARAALEKRGHIPTALSQDLAKAVNPEFVDGRTFQSPDRTSGARGRDVELSGEERDKFAKLGRIEPDQVWTCDLDELARQLQS
jgi:hypothetical protein